MTVLRLREGSRAASLVARLDCAYTEFTRTLPPGLRALARETATFRGVPGDGAFRVSDMNPGITLSPWLFWELIEDLGDQEILQVAEAGTLVVLASVVLDHLSDGQASSPGQMTLLHQALYESGVRRFRACLPPESGFWPHFERLGAEHIAGLSAELDSQADPSYLTWDSFCAMVPGKFAFIVVTMAAFVEYSGRGDLLTPIEKSINDLAVASQLLDDMGDWQEDLASRHMTYYMSRLAPPAAWCEPEWPSGNDLQARIDADWLDIEHMELVQSWLESAELAVQTVPCQRWKEYLQGYKSLAEQHLERFKARHVLGIIESILEDSPGPATSDGVFPQGA